MYKRIRIAGKRYTDPGTLYAVNVLTGNILASQYVRDACRRHVEDLKKQVKQQYVYEPKLAKRFEDFCLKLTVLKDGSDPVRFRLLPFQQFIAYMIFGWIVGPKTKTKYIPGTRKYRIAVIYTAKSNGKTPFCCAIDLFMMCLDGYKNLKTGKWKPEINPDCYITASNKDQAIELGIDVCKELLEYSPKLKEFFKFKFSKAEKPNGFRCLLTNAKYTALTYVRGGSGKSGKRVSHIHAEEPHEWTKDSGQLEILLHGAKNRPQQLCLIASNAPKTTSGIAWDYRVAAIRACRTHKPENLFGFIAECDPEDFPGRKSERKVPHHKHWYKANPALGTIITEASIESNVERARTPDELTELNRLNFGLVPGDAGGLFERVYWDEAVVKKLSKSEFESKYSPDKCKLYITFDLAERKNFTAIGELYVPYDENVKPYMRYKYFTPSMGFKSLARASTGKLELWAEEGWLTKLEGSVIKLKTIGEHIYKLCAKYTDHEIAGDQHRTRHMTDDCNSAGYPMDLITTKDDVDNFVERGQLKIMGHSQGAHPNKVTKLGMDQSISDFQLCVMEKLIQFENNPVTSWCLECVQVIFDTHRMKKLDKKTATKHDAGTDDGVTVSVMCSGLWQLFVRREGISIEHWLKIAYRNDPNYSPFASY